MNNNTMKYIAVIAGFIADQVSTSGKSLKWAKAYAMDALEEATTPFDELDNVDFTQARLMLQILVNETRKDRLIYNARGLVTNMNRLRGIN